MNTTQNEQIYKIWDDFLSFELKASPGNSSYLEYRRYDHQLPDMSYISLETYIQRLKEFLGNIEDLQPIPDNHQQDNIEVKTDLHIFKPYLESNIFNLEVIKEYSWNPVLYIRILGRALNIILDRYYQDHLVRYEAIIQRIKAK